MVSPLSDITIYLIYVNGCGVTSKIIEKDKKLILLAVTVD